MSDQDQISKNRFNNFMERFRLMNSVFAVTVFTLIIYLAGIADCRVWYTTLGWILGAVVQYFINTWESRDVDESL